MSEPPLNIRALQAEQLLELTWEGREPVRFPYIFVRGECPCASCRNEWTGERMLDPAAIRPDLKIEGLEAVGNYAVRIQWSDSHSSGLYSWDYLANLIPTDFAGGAS